MLSFRPLFSSTDNNTFKSNIFCFFFALQNFNRSVSNRYAHNVTYEPFININIMTVILCLDSFGYDTHTVICSDKAKSLLYQICSQHIGHIFVLHLKILSAFIVNQRSAMIFFLYRNI